MNEMQHATNLCMHCMCMHFISYCSIRDYRDHQQGQAELPGALLRDPAVGGPPPLTPQGAHRGAPRVGAPKGGLYSKGAP